MTLSPRVGGATSKPVDVSPSPAAQRFASNSCVTTKMTYEFFNELIENFTLAQASYAVTNVPNDPNALKKLLDSLRTGGYNFSMGTLNLTGGLITNNTDISIGLGKIFFNNNDWVNYDDGTNSFEFYADSTIANSTVRTGNINAINANIDTINERTVNNGVTIDGILIKDTEIYFGADDKITYNDIPNTFSFSSDGSVANSKILCGELDIGIDSQGIVTDSNGIRFFQNGDSSRSTYVNSRGNVVINIDSSNINTDRAFYIKKNAIDNSGTNLFSVEESGLISTYNGDIQVGAGKINFNTLNQDYLNFNDTTNVFQLVADNAVSNSILEVGTIKLDTLNVDAVNEKTSNAGVTIEGVLIKDAIITSPQVLKAMVRFNGTGTPAILSSYNVASITDSGTGTYQVNFTNALANTNYCVVVSASYGGDTAPITYIDNRTTTDFDVICKNFNGDNFILTDPVSVDIAVY